MSMTLKEMQERVDDLAQDHDGSWDEFQLLARLSEELGEMAGALQRQAGLRPRQGKGDVVDEAGELLFALVAFANKLELDLTVCIEAVIAKYQDRDADAWRARHR